MVERSCGDSHVEEPCIGRSSFDEFFPSRSLKKDNLRVRERVRSVKDTRREAALAGMGGLSSTASSDLTVSGLLILSSSDSGSCIRGNAGSGLRTRATAGSGLRICAISGLRARTVDGSGLLARTSGSGLRTCTTGRGLLARLTSSTLFDGMARSIRCNGASPRLGSLGDPAGFDRAYCCGTAGRAFLSGAYGKGLFGDLGGVI